jgi:cellulose synthase/poly-beta-1,6-N-acetylglucosamine synthase-like glycosyltransferase
VSDLLVRIGEGSVLTYFVAIHLSYLGLNLAAFWSFSRGAAKRLSATLPVEPALLPPITILVPAFNEERVIVASVRSLLQLTYPNFEVVVVNDGSTDGTVAVLTEHFDLVPYAEAYRDLLTSAPVRGFLVSRRHPNLRVVNKENGGRSDALNVGINAARSPLFCTIDADSVLQRDSLERVVRPFLEDPRTVGAGGTVRIANGCTVRHGFLERQGLPRRPLELFQVVEYLRAFLFGRLGWSTIDGLLVLSGAFGVFRRDVVVRAGGFRVDTIGEDMELVVRLHRTLASEGRPYRIAYVPDPICWTEAPSTLRGLGRQRIRWQRGLGEALTKNRGLVFRRGSRGAGWISYPFHFVFELFGPLFEVLAYTLSIAGFAAGVIDGRTFVAFLFVSIGLGMAFSASALALEELTFSVYPRTRDLTVMLVAALAENAGYRQVNALWRLVGFVRWVGRAPSKWGEIERSGSWSSEAFPARSGTSVHSGR